ncbi:hypothetical protein Aeh1ORF106c [Aeromonas phage Aeh1]|uniref:Uncharacterized protein n=1 Tax=Aeromonas phage Aeh1 TaxID=2880362 RepID=Q76YX9_9CAUD|nr:hypothetical protein Aeh1p112 [Aeromonas phage Aeh1]AAQ17767.1 hypothetical protein Aeh1ORF106c [Aeromonas phage Aeh1]
MATYSVTTEGDCEGRSIRHLGVYSGEIKKIVSLLLLQGKNPYYGYNFQPVEVLRADHLNEAKGVKVTKSSFSESYRVVVDEHHNRDYNLLEEAKKQLRGLSPEHIRVLKEHLNSN